MSDDLKARLRIDDPVCEEHHIQNEAAARIEALELALTQSRAETAAAYERAAEACTTIIKNYDCMKADGETYQPMWVQKVAKGMVSIARQDIRALATPEQSAALDAVKAEARAQGMREAAEIVSGPIWRLILRDEGCIDRPCHSESDLCECRSKHARILAAIQKGECK